MSEENPKIESSDGAVSSSSEAVDVRDISIGDVLRGIARLKLSSIVILLGIAVAIVSSTATFVAARYVPRLNEIERMQEAFALRFADRSVLQSLGPEVLEEQPDGLATYEEAMASLLWQVKSQAGFAEFLAGDRSVSVQVHYADDGIEFEWDHGSNVVLKILANLGYEPEADRVTQLNAELNLLGVAWVDAENTIVRHPDGGLVVITQDE